MTKIRLNLESLDARIVPDANPGNPMPPPATVEISVPVTPPMMPPPPTNAPPGLDARTILAGLLAQYNTANAVVTKDVLDAQKQAVLFGTKSEATNAAQMAIMAAPAADQAAMLPAFQALVAQEAAALQSMRDAVYTYRADKAELVRIGLLIHQLAPAQDLPLWDVLDPSINKYVPSPEDHPDNLNFG